MGPKQVIIVTGASSGVGAATARWLGKSGAAVALLGRSEDRLDSVSEDVKRLGGRALAISVDVSDATACRRAVNETMKKFNRIDALVNNAGIIQPIAAVSDADVDNWRRNIEVNLNGPFYMIHHALPEIRKQAGRVVNVSSGAANRVLANVSAYCAAKAALNHFTRVLAAEEPGITAVCVRPGVVDTPMQEVLRGNMPDGQAAYYAGLKDRGELEPPEVPGRAIAWLALTASREISGQFLDYDDASIDSPAREMFGEYF